LSKKRIGSLLGTTVLIAAIVTAALNVQLIQDAARYYQYVPSAQIASFVTDTGMNDKGKFLFYASQPMLSEKEEFNQHCVKQERTSAILGCYNGANIYIYNVDDERLDGIRATTAAHEMLHAAYARLSGSERERVDGLLEAEYEKLKNDKELAERMDFYARTQPGDRANELHSIIGTEVRSIGDELEEHYSRYFSSRSKVVEQHERYHSVFVQLTERADSLTGQIDKLGDTIKSQRAAYDSQARMLSGAIDDFNRRADNGDFSSQAAFSYERQQLLAKTAEVDSLRQAINTNINKYNALVAELNSIATETEALNRSIDSNLEPAPSLDS
jgi:hypothetical protein